MYSSEPDSRGIPELYSSRPPAFRDLGHLSYSDANLPVSANPNNSDRRLPSSDNGLFPRGQDAAAMFAIPSMVCYLVLFGCLLHRQKRLGPQTSGNFSSIPQYDPGLVHQVNVLRDENARLRHENETARNEAQTWR